MRGKWGANSPMGAMVGKKGGGGGRKKETKKKRNAKRRMSGCSRTSEERIRGDVVDRGTR